MAFRVNGAAETQPGLNRVTTITDSANATCYPDFMQAIPIEHFSQGVAFSDLLLQLTEATLKERDASIVTRRFGLLGQDPQTLEAIGRAEGVTRERIRQILMKSLFKLGTKARRQYKNGQTDEPGPILIRWIRELVRPDEPDAGERILSLCAEELPHLDAASVVTPLVGNLWKGPSAAKSYQALVRECLKGNALESLLQTRLLREKWDAERRLDHLLRGVVWPQTATRFTEEEVSGMFSRQRQTSDSSSGHTGVLFSAKLKREVAFESGLERQFLMLLEACDDVVYYQEQPLTVSYYYQGRRRVYCPDLVFSLADGRVVAVEIKPRNGMALHRNWAKWAALSQHCEEKGFGFLVTDGCRSVQDVAKREVRSLSRQAILAAVATGSLDWQLIRKFGEDMTSDFLSSSL